MNHLYKLFLSLAQFIKIVSSKFVRLLPGVTFESFEFDYFQFSSPYKQHCVKRVCVRSFQNRARKTQKKPRKTANTGFFYVVQGTLITKIFPLLVVLNHLTCATDFSPTSAVYNNVYHFHNLFDLISSFSFLAKDNIRSLKVVQNHQILVFYFRKQLWNKCLECHLHNAFSSKTLHVVLPNQD